MPDSRLWRVPADCSGRCAKDPDDDVTSYVISARIHSELREITFLAPLLAERERERERERETETREREGKVKLYERITTVHSLFRPCPLYSSIKVHAALEFHSSFPRVSKRNADVFASFCSAENFAN